MSALYCIFISDLRAIRYTNSFDGDRKMKDRNKAKGGSNCTKTRLIHVAINNYCLRNIDKCILCQLRLVYVSCISFQ